MKNNCSIANLVDLMWLKFCFSNCSGNFAKACLSKSTFLLNSPVGAFLGIYQMLP